MAVKGNGAGKPKAKKGGKKKGAPGIGDNSNFKVDRKAVRKFLVELDALHEQLASVRGSIMEQIKEKYQDMANDLGAPRSLCRTLYGEHKYEKKKQESDKKRDPEMATQMDKLRVAAEWKNSPLFKASEERKEREVAAKEMADAGATA